MFGQKLFSSKNKTTKEKATYRQDPIAKMEQEIVEAESSTVEATGSTEPA